MALPHVGPRTIPLLGRLRQVLESGRVAGRFASLQDLMVLVRQLLLMRGDRGLDARLNVPRKQGWPDEATWKSFGFRITRTGTRLILEAKAWRPDWLGASIGQDGDVFHYEHKAQLVRCDARLPMDPFLREATGFDCYICPGQREAILSALFMPAGDTLIVNLPTGSGKSLVAQAPELIRGPDAGLTLVVVPTNALAIDLERRTRELLLTRDSDQNAHELSWIGTRSEDSHKSIKQRIRSGSQGILFASPEAVCGALLNSLYLAAERGLLAYLVVDEAHLIAQWGDDFRPAFQQLSGVRRGLLEACSGERFRTLLLSATFSRQVIETLKILFGTCNDFNMVSAVHLRPEPRYLSYRCRDADEKKKLLYELVRYVPRPFIFYTTRRKDAKEWFRRLQEAGFLRIACVHGETPNGERELVIRDWVKDRLEGVVATSAFGVGMDKSDVRAVIHAAVPETLDRFYQEVGRGGRDGRGSLSITVFDNRDIEIARKMSAPTLIGDERGYERWKTLYHEAEWDPQAPDLRTVDLRKLPGGLTQESDYNRDWNMRTLILLARAGLIELQSSRPLRLERIHGEKESVFRERTKAIQEAYFSRIPVRSLDPKLMDRNHFEHEVGVERDRGMESANRAFDQMLGALTGEKEMAEVLVQLFASDSVVVSRACRGCPKSNGVPHDDSGVYQIPPGIGISRLAPYDYHAWRHRFGDMDASLVVVLCHEDRLTKSLFEALRAAVATFGVQELALQPWLQQSQPEFSELHKWTNDRVVVFRDLDDIHAAPGMLPLARATTLLPWGDRPFPDELLLLDRPLHLVFAPFDLQDSRHPGRQYRDTASHCLELKEFLRRATK